MSSTDADQPLDLREQIARIDRAQAETRKFVAEQQKLVVEQLKLAAEQQKLAAEGKKFERERCTAAVLAAAAAGAVLMRLFSH